MGIYSNNFLKTDIMCKTRNILTRYKLHQWQQREQFIVKKIKPTVELFKKCNLNVFLLQMKQTLNHLCIRLWGIQQLQRAVDVRLPQFFKEALIGASQVVYLCPADSRSNQLHMHLLFHVHMPRFTRLSLSQSNPPLSVLRASVNSLDSSFYLKLILFSCCIEEIIVLATLLLAMKGAFGFCFFFFLPQVYKCYCVILKITSHLTCFYTYI